MGERDGIDISHYYLSIEMAFFSFIFIYINTIQAVGGNILAILPTIYYKNMSKIDIYYI